MNELDTFSRAFELYFKQHQIPISRSEFLVFSGQWLRVSLAYLLKRQVNLGHPYGELSWDFLGLIRNTFGDLNLSVKFISGVERNNLAKNTIAKGEREFSDKYVKYVSSKDEFISVIEKMANLSEEAVIGKNDGKYYFLTNSRDSGSVSYSDVIQNVTEYYELPFGPIIFVPLNTKSVGVVDFPWNSIRYLSWTFERGEERTESVDKFGYTSVSGWKAYARWMNHYILPDRGKSIFHQNIRNLPSLIRDRRLTSITYWEKLAEQNQHKDLSAVISKLIKILNSSIEITNRIDLYYSNDIQDKAVRQLIRELYFNEQKTLPVFNELKRIYHNIHHKKLE